MYRIITKSKSLLRSALVRMLVIVLAFQLIIPAFHIQPSIVEAAENLPTADEVIEALTQKHPGKNHPRILATAEDFARVRANIANDDFAQYIYQQLKADAQAILSKSLPAAISLEVSRSTLADLLILGLMVQIGEENKTPYVNKAWAILQNAGNFSHWNPGHFLDTAEMLMAFAIGYDWFYDEWTDEQRAFIRNAIAAKGLQPALNAYHRGYSASDAWWANVTFNWNTVCNSGITNAALAVADEPDTMQLAGELLELAIAHIQKVVEPAYPDGGGEEGSGYWEYNYKYFVYYAASMFSALGTDYGFTDAQGISETPYFPIYLNGPGGSFNYGDNYTEVVKDPLFLWFAKRFNNMDFARYRLGHLSEGTKPEALDILWYSPDMKDDSYEIQLPLDRLFSTVDVGMMRSAWYDRNALYVGLKGSSNLYNHGHLDQGTFVLDALGVRWAIDLGPDSYSLPNYFELVSGRSQYYRQRTEGHNTIVLNPSQEDGQYYRSHADIIRTGSAPDQAFMIIDMTEGYQKHATSVKRGMALIDNRTKFLLQDELTMKEPGEFYWFMHTRADITIEDDGKSAILTMGDKKLWAHILTDNEDLRFTIRDPIPLPTSINPGGQAANSGVKLTIHGYGIKDLQLAVLFVPLLEWEEAPVNLPEVIDLDQWSVPDTDVARLEGIYIDGEKIQGFDDSKFIYYYGLTDLEAIPEIQAYPVSEGDSVTVEMPDSLPGTATIRVHSGDGTVRDSEYRLVLSFPFNPYAAVIASTHDGNVPENTLDGNLNTRWSAEGDGQWIQYRLTETREISEVKIAFYNGHQRATIFKILVSPDGKAWTEVFNGRSSGTTNQFETFSFDPVVAKYIRIVGYGNTVNAWNSLSEVDFDGKPGVTVPDVFQSVSATLQNGKIPVGGTTRMNVTGSMKSGASIDLSSVDIKYFSLDPSIAIINAQGEIEGVGLGRTKLWAEVTLNGYTKVAVVELEVNDGSPSPTPGPDVLGWEFTDGLEGFTQGNMSEYRHLEGGYVYGVLSNHDPIMLSPDNLNFDISDKKIIRIRMKNGTPRTRAKLYFSTNAEQTINEAKAKAFDIYPNSDFTEYVIDMSTNPYWTGTLKQFRFDPIDNGTFTIPAGQVYSFTLDYIRIEPEPVAAPVASNVTISGLLEVGETLTGSYTFSQSQGKPESGTVYRWLRAETANGTYTEIPGANGISYQLTADDIGKYLKFEVTPKVAGKAGVPATSSAAGPVRQKLSVRLTGSASVVSAGETYDIVVEAAGLTENIYAASVVMEFDSQLFSFVSIEEASSGIQIVATDTGTPGKIRVVLISVDGMTENMPLFDLRLEAKSINDRTETVIRIAGAEFGAAPDGEILEAVLDEITVAFAGMDLNENGIIDIGDLAIAVYHYQKTSESPDWETARMADINHDGVVDILDLALIASKILEY